MVSYASEYTTRGTLNRKIDEYEMAIIVNILGDDWRLVQSTRQQCIPSRRRRCRWYLIQVRWDGFADVEGWRQREDETEGGRDATNQPAFVYKRVFNVEKLRPCTLVECTIIRIGRAFLLVHTTCTFYHLPKPRRKDKLVTDVPDSEPNLTRSTVVGLYRHGELYCARRTSPWKLSRPY